MANSGAASEENFVKMTYFFFQCYNIKVCLVWGMVWKLGNDPPMFASYNSHVVGGLFTLFSR